MNIRSGVLQDKNLARQFFSIHHEVFPFLNLEKAVAEGFIGSNIETFSLLDQEEKTCAILIVTPMTLRIGDCLFQTVQIGGMATSPQERGKGFGGQLLSHVVDLYLPKIDFLFLFAHRGVVEFYPRYGFKRVRQENFSIDVSRSGKRVFEKLDLQKQDARKRFDYLLAKRTEVSNAVCVLNSDWLRHFYYRFVFPNHLWIDSLNEVIIAATREQKTLVVHDVISASVDPLLFQDISWPEIDKITIGFTPDLYTGNFSVSQISDDDQMFVQGRFPNTPSPFKFPSFFQT